MYNTDIFKIETNHVVPARGKILISEPFLCDYMFGRSVILLIDHTKDGVIGLVMNKPLSIMLNEIIDDFKDYGEDIPIYKGGPLSMDTLFYLHTLPGIPGSLQIGEGFYVNGDFNAVKAYIRTHESIKGVIRFFLGYSGWGYEQLHQEIKENTWFISKTNREFLMDEEASPLLWEKTLSTLGGKYKMWARFPQVPSLN